MTLHRSMIRSAFLTTALVLIAAQDGSAQQQRTLYQWTGRVDRQVHIVMRGRSVSTRMVGDNERGRGQSRVASVLPRENGHIVVHVRRGRGDVDVIQQPNDRNGYTAVVRIRDDRSGADQYQIAVSWRRDGRGNGGWDRGNDRNDRGDRDRDDRGDWDRDGRDRDDRDDRGDRDDRDDRGGWGGFPGRGNDAGNRVIAHFSGRVDDEVDLRIQGRRAMTSNRSGNGTSGVRIDVRGLGLPQRDMNVSVRNNEGRGSVSVVQQPSSRNDYTAIIRIRDPQGGFGAYDFDVIW